MVVLNPTSTQSFQQNYYSFLMAFANAVNQPLSTVTMTNITFGSVTVYLVISSFAQSGSALASTQQSNLQNMLNQGIISNITVFKSSLVANGASSDDGNSGLSKTDIIIIAVVVPVGFLSNFLHI